MKQYIILIPLLCIFLLFSPADAVPVNSLLDIVGTYRGTCVWENPAKGTKSNGWAELKIQHDAETRYLAKLTYQAGKSSVVASRFYLERTGQLLELSSFQIGDKEYPAYDQCEYHLIGGWYTNFTGKLNIRGANDLDGRYLEWSWEEPKKLYPRTILQLNFTREAGR